MRLYLEHALNGLTCVIENGEQPVFHTKKQRPRQRTECMGIHALKIKRYLHIQHHEKNEENEAEEKCWTQKPILFLKLTKIKLTQ